MHHFRESKSAPPGVGDAGVAASLELSIDEFEEGGEEVRSAMEWAQVRALAADGVSQREIAARLGINRRTVARLAAAAEPPRYERHRRGRSLIRWSR